MGKKKTCLTNGKTNKTGGGARRSEKELGGRKFFRRDLKEAKNARKPHPLQKAKGKNRGGKKKGRRTHFRWSYKKGKKKPTIQERGPV